MHDRAGAGDGTRLIYASLTAGKLSYDVIWSVYVRGGRTYKDVALDNVLGACPVRCQNGLQVVKDLILGRQYFAHASHRKRRGPRNLVDPRGLMDGAPTHHSILDWPISQ